mgnify:CR=1 FL=1
MARWNAKSLSEKIDSEGFDYFFRYYVSVSRLPNWLQRAAQAYCNAANNLEKTLQKHGVELEGKD